MGDEKDLADVAVDGDEAGGEAGACVFVGNFEYSAERRDVEDLFEKYGRVNKTDMKQGFAFVFMERKADAEDAIEALDGLEWGIRRKRRLKVEWARGDGERAAVIHLQNILSSRRTMHPQRARHQRLCCRLGNLVCSSRLFSAETPGVSAKG